MTRWLSLAVLTATVALLGLVPAAQAVERVGPNYRLDSDSSPFRGQDQIGLAVNPANPQHVVAVYANYLDSRCEASASFDGGTTWSAAFQFTPPGANPFDDYAKGCNNSFGTSQYVEFGTGNNVYTVTGGQKRGIGFLQDSSQLLYKSTDGGVTWQQGVVAMQGGPGSSNFSSGPVWYRAGLSVDAGAAGGADRIYLVARMIQGPETFCQPATTPPTRCYPMRSVVSDDGGQTFSEPVQVSPVTTNTTDYASKPIVNDDGSVTVAWRTFGAEGLIQVARSTDNGRSWGAPVDVARVKNTGTSGSHVTLAPSGSATYPRMIGAPGGRLYLVYSQGSTGPTAPEGGYQGADHFISPDSQVWFQRSRDGGLTWEAPKRISEQTSLPGSRTHQTRHPSIHVSPSGRINVVWHDRRHWFQMSGERQCTHSHTFCPDIRLGDTYYSYSNDGGDSFSTPMRITDRSHNNEVGYDTRPSGYWWFAPQAVTVGDDDVLVAWMDSREGNWDTDTEDIYLAKVNFDATGDAPTTYVDAPDAISRSVALSELGYQGGTEGALVGGKFDTANPPDCPPASCPGGPASRNASSVVIVNQDDVAGALAGSVLARANPGPVLLSPASGLTAALKAEVARMAPAQAFVIGDAASLSAQVAADVAAAAGIGAGQVTRLSGGSDAATAALIAAALDPRTQAEKDSDLQEFDAAVIANPATPDGAAAAGLAAARRLPILYVGANSIPAETSAALTSLDIDTTLVIGGTSAVSDAVLAALPNGKRLGGADVYATSRAVVAESLARGLPSNVVYVANGAEPMDAVLLGGVVARASGMLVLAPGPLSTTAAGQATGFGLDGISRFFLVAPDPNAPPPPPPPPPVAPPPPPPVAPPPVAPPAPPPPPAPAPAADRTAPLARLFGATRQRLLPRLRPTVKLAVSCTSEPCTAVAAATIRVPKVGRSKARSFKLRTVTTRIAKGARKKVVFRISTLPRLVTQRAIRSRRAVSVRVTVTVRDSAGNRRTLRRTIRLLR